MKKLFIIIGAILALILGASSAYAVVNNHTNKQYDEAITKATDHVAKHEWADAQASYKDAAKVKQTDVTAAANEQLIAIMNAQKIAGNDQKGAIAILDDALKLKVTVPVIDKEIKSLKDELKKQLDEKKAKADKTDSRSDLKPEQEPTQSETQPNAPQQPEQKPNVDATREANIAEGNMTVAQARARLAEQGKNIDWVPDSEVQQLIAAVKAANGKKSLLDISNDMRW